MKKFLSYFIDYIWFSLFLTSALLKLNFSLLPLILTLLFTPLLFAPLDALFLKLTRSSMGKSLFSLYAFNNKSTSWLSAIHGAFKQALFNQLMLIFPITLFFYKWLKRLNLSLTVKKRTIRERLVSFCTILMMISYALFSKEMAVQKLSSYFVTHDIKKSESSAEDNWIAQSDENLKFKAYFPGKIQLSEERIEIPNTVRVLNLKTYTNKSDSIEYELTHTKLPSSWVKWSNKLVLNGALNALCDYEKGKITSRKNITIGGKNGIEFVMKLDNKMKSGRLILDKQTLYRIEGIWESDFPIQKEHEERLEKFIDLFSLNS
jgi:hypothetical protein